MSADVSPEEYLTASELKKIREDPLLEPEEVAKYRRQKDGLGGFDQ